LDIFLARQPIFDRSQKVHAYELLFRASRSNRFPDEDPDAATARLIDYVTTGFNLDRLTGARTAFVNLPRRVLVEELYRVLPGDRVVLELLETVKPDEEVVRACRRLREQGYALALDDFEDSPEHAELIELAAYLKVDFRATRPEECRRLAESYGARLALLAEKVESLEEVREARALGYQYFQGYYFCRPEVLSGREIPPSKLAYLEFFNSVFRTEVDYAHLEDVIRRDLSLAVKLLRIVNATAQGSQRTIRSVKEALIRLGEGPLQKWAALLALSHWASGKPGELILTSLVRGRVCELLAGPLGWPRSAHTLFLVGVLSLLEALLDRPREQILGELALSDEIRAGLERDDSRFGRIRCLVVAYERGDWDRTSQLSAELGLAPGLLPRLYVEALRWATELSTQG
jgi:EAL and modified HD-GYP domain-containing signal transduction protein